MERTLPFFLSIRDVINGQSLIYIVIVIAVVFNVATIRAGHQWEGDFALYTAHARNIANGHDFSDTGYIFNPERPFLSPKNYPPVFPAFLAPVYKLFGLDLQAIKIASILAFALFLLVFQRYVRTRLRYSVSQLAVVAAVAFSPWFWAAKDNILPDFLFILLIYSAVLLMDSTYTSENTNWRRYLFAIFTGFVVYLAYGSRSIGMVLIPAIIFSDIVRLRSIRRITLLIVAVFSVFYFIQSAVLQTDQSYINTFKTTLHSKVNNHSPAKNDMKPAPFEVKALFQKFGKTLSSNAEYYHQAISAYWNSNVSKALNNIAYATMGLFAITGFLFLVLKKPSSGDSLLLVYVCLLLLVPFRQSRYLLPLVPLYLVYIFHGLEVLLSRGSFFREHVAYNSSILGLLLVIILSYIGSYSKESFDDFTNGVEKKESVELFEFIRRNTPESSVLISHKPRLLALFTDRNSSIYRWSDEPGNLLDYFDRISATHVVVARESSGIVEAKGFVDWVESNPDKFKIIFENPDFHVYRIL
jgi:hypothetical protein